jgi:NADH-ubiquinone oxidoreductase chain 5
MYLNIVFLPLIGAFLAGFGGRFFGPLGSAILTTFCVISSLFFSFFAFFEVGFSKSPCFIKLLTWFNSEFLCANWGFQFDSLTVVMLIVVTFISGLVHLYSTEYMSHDPHLPRFMSYLSLFTFFMLILVTADNFIQLFVGWEGVGLCSYLLINFWFSRIQANKAAIKAMIVNRIGDFGLALGIFAIYITFNSVEYSAIFALVPLFENDVLTFFSVTFPLLPLIAILLFVGAIGKSAQLGLHSWLPDAMEGPTPVSALIHAATMVTAGIFLLTRCSPIFEYAPSALFIVTFVGSITAFFAATAGLLQNDLKRVIAYSTCSQLGYMIFACGISNYAVGIFHLTNHAFFKALLFLGAGSVIHAVADEQDMRRMGGLKRLIPFTFAVMSIGSFALIGFPFLAGFYSKDVILEVAFAKYNTASHFSYCLGTFAAFFTAFYSIRLAFLTFLSESNGFKSVVFGVSDSSFKMALPLFILTFPSIFVGYLLRDLFIGFGTGFWNNSIFNFPTNLNLIDAEFASPFFKLLPVFLSLFGASIALFLYAFFFKDLYLLKTSFIGKKLYIFLSRKWFFDRFHNEFINQVFLKFAYHVTYKTIDRGFIEMIGPYGLSKTVLMKSRTLSNLQTGSVYDYSLWMFVGFIFSLLTLQFAIFFSSLIDSSLIFLFFITFLNQKKRFLSFSAYTINLCDKCFSIFSSNLIFF